jgi:hypothetical protein
MHAAIVASTLLFSYVTAPHAEMREKPEKESKVLSDAYYSEAIKVIEEAGEWAKIETAVDGYQGWVKRNVFCAQNHAFGTDPSKTYAKVIKRIAHIYDRQDTEYGPVLDLPFESRLEVVDPLEPDSKSRWIKVSLLDGTTGYIQRGCIRFEAAPITREEMCKLACSNTFQGIEYLWGGRSSFGYDCSGFAQMLYRQMGVYIPRDSKDQVNWSGFRKTSREELKPGDLIFFGLAEDTIRHVGMYVGDDCFVHATIAENMPDIHLSVLSDAEWNGQGRYSYHCFRTLA